MIKSLIVQGLKIRTHCKYIKFTQDRTLSIKEDGIRSVFEIRFPKGFNSGNIISKKISLVYKTELQETDYIPVVNPIINLSGVKIRKIIDRVINYSQIIVKDIDEFIIEFDENKATVLIPASKQDDIDTYLECLGGIPYFEIVEVGDIPQGRLTNLYNLNLHNKDQVYCNKSHFVFESKAFYDRYSLRMIDILYSFITQLTTILEDYGIQLVGYPVDEDKLTPNNILYRITDLGDQVSHKSDSNEMRYAVQHRTNIEFELTTPNFVMYNDFKTRYQNLDLVSNFTEFYTNDKYSVRWISTAKWGEIESNFNQEYDQDQQGNFAFHAAFSVELYYYVVFDETFGKVQEFINKYLVTSVWNDQQVEI
jgi:hypothetical protein